jgi:hypothetical protein
MWTQMSLNHIRNHWAGCENEQDKVWLGSNRERKADQYQKQEARSSTVDTTSIKHERRFFPQDGNLLLLTSADATRK